MTRALILGCCLLTLASVYGQAPDAIEDIKDVNSKYYWGEGADRPSALKVLSEKLADVETVYVEARTEVSTRETGGKRPSVSDTYSRQTVTSAFLRVQEVKYMESRGAVLCYVPKENVQDFFYEKLLADIRAEQEAMKADAAKTRQEVQALRGELSGMQAALSEFRTTIRPTTRAEEKQVMQAEAWFDLAIKADEQGDYTEAIRCFKNVIALKPNDANAYNNMGYAYDMQGNTAEAIRCYQKAIAIDPNDAIAYYNLGNAYREQGNYAEAIRCYKKAIAIDPTDAETYNNMGVVYANQKNYVEAIRYFEKAVELDPNDAIAYKNMGNAYAHLGNYAEARRWYKIATALDPNNAEAYLFMGNAYSIYGYNYAEAIRCYEKAIALDPNYATAYNCMGLAYKDQGNYAEAIRCYEKAIALKPDYAAAYLNMGNAYNRLGQQSAACAAWQKALELDDVLAWEMLRKYCK